MKYEDRSRELVPMVDRLPGMVWVVLYARVGMNCLMLFLDESERKKKNEARRRFSSSHHSAMVLAIEVFPEPAAP